jgi:hypothetical protein
MERPQDHQGQHADIAVIDENVSPRRTVSSRRSPGQGTADLGLFLVTAIMLKIQAQFGRLKTPPTWTPTCVHEDGEAITGISDLMVRLWPHRPVISLKEKHK